MNSTSEILEDTSPWNAYYAIQYAYQQIGITDRILASYIRRESIVMSDTRGRSQNSMIAELRIAQETARDVANEIERIISHINKLPSDRKPSV